MSTSFSGQRRHAAQGAARGRLKLFTRHDTGTAIPLPPRRICGRIRDRADPAHTITHTQAALFAIVPYYGLAPRSGCAGLLLLIRSLQGGNFEFFHLQQCLHNPFRFRRVLVLQHLG